MVLNPLPHGARATPRQCYLHKVATQAPCLCLQLMRVTADESKLAVTATPDLQDSSKGQGPTVKALPQNSATELLLSTSRPSLSVSGYSPLSSSVLRSPTCSLSAYCPPLTCGLLRGELDISCSEGALPPPLPRHPSTPRALPALPPAEPALSRRGARCSPDCTGITCIQKATHSF